MKNNADFVFDFLKEDQCLCGMNDEESSLKIYDNNDTSSSENEEDYFSYIYPEITEDELKGFTLLMENPLKCLKPVLHFLDSRMSDKILSYIDPEIFFVDSKEKKINFMMSAPNSYFPLLKKSAISKDVICAPSYLTEREEEYYVKPFFIDFGRFTHNNLGYVLKFISTDRTEEQSNYIYFQGKFYESIVKDRFVNGKKGEDEEQDQEYDFPISLYEPVTFLKRFCEVFYYLNISFTEICGKKLSEENMIKKFTSGLFSGFHKILGSQGMPLPALIGETYEFTDATGNFELFAEVKNDKPITICYNIRWQKREAMIDGTIEFGFKFDENNDEFIIKMNGISKIRILSSENTYITFYFNFPQSLSYHQIIDQSKNERCMTVNGLMYIKGDTYCAIFNFNFLKSMDFSSKLIGFIKKSIININTLINGHSFIALLFHSSSFSFPSKIKNSDILNEMFIKKKPKKSVVLNKKDIDKDNIIQEMSPEKDKSYLNIAKPSKIRVTTAIKKNRLNKNPNIYLKKVFTKIVEVTIMLVKNSDFVTSFSEGFIDKILIGSWVRMNFYEVNLNNNDELSEYYLQFDHETMKANSHSKYNKKNGIYLTWDNFEFYKTLKKQYREDCWRYIKNPLPTDTRYREDFLWLLRYFQIIGRTEGYGDKPQDELEKLRIEAIINAGKWKDLLDVYVYSNISKNLNVPKQSQTTPSPVKSKK